MIICSISNIFKILFMEPMEDQNCSQEFEEVFSSNKTSEDAKFDAIISELQEIVIDLQFEKTLGAFMKKYWGGFDGNASQQQEKEVFLAYKAEIQQYLQAGITKKIPDFSWGLFRQLLENRKNLIDQQILDTLLSLEEIDSFRSFIKDFRSSYEEVEMFKVLTVKSNKLSQNKKVKGKDNIFAGSNAPLFDKGLQAPIQKKKSTVEKTEEELLVPDLILTVKPMRKQ